MKNEFDLVKNLPDLTKEVLSSLPPSKWHKKAVQLIDENPDGKFAVACSGGADSTLVLLLAKAYLRHKPIILHVNHHSRGIDSDNDAIFVRELAQKLGLRQITLDITDPGKLDEGSLHDQRLHLLKSAMREEGIHFLLQGHNADDVVETLLWRLPRGVCVEQLSAPRAISKHRDAVFIRPLLTISAAEIKTIMSSTGIPWREDTSNQSSRYLRNRLRKEVVPRWKEVLDRNLIKGINISRDLLEEVDDLLEDLSADFLLKWCSSGKIPLKEFRKLHRALQRKILWKWGLKNQCKLSLSTIDKVLIGIDSSKNLKFDIEGGTRLSVNGSFIEFIEFPNEGVLASFFTPVFPAGRIFLPRSRVVALIRCPLGKEMRDKILGGSVDKGCEAWVDADKLYPYFVGIRLRKNGDRFRPINSPGRRKLKDWMIDRKWTKARRNETPIFVDANDSILWVPGFPPCDAMKITPSTTSVIRLTYSHTET